MLCAVVSVFNCLVFGVVFGSFCMCVRLLVMVGRVEILPVKCYYVCRYGCYYDCEPLYECECVHVRM